MLLGIVVNNASEKMELAVDNETGHVKIRFTDKGAWSAWQRIDVKRKGNADNGELDVRGDHRQDGPNREEIGLSRHDCFWRRCLRNRQF